MIFEHGESYSYSTPRRVGVSEKKCITPLKLAGLKRVDALSGGNSFSIHGYNLAEITTLLESEECKNFEWDNDIITEKMNSASKSLGSEFFTASYKEAMRNRPGDWIIAAEVHVPDNGHPRHRIPDGWAMNRFDRPMTRNQQQHALAPKPLPHWILESAWEHEADDDISKVQNVFMDMTGNDGSRILEGWVISIPQSMVDNDPEGVDFLPSATVPLIEMQQNRPVGQVWLAIITRGPPTTLRGYFALSANTAFEPPPFSVMAGMPRLYINSLLRDLMIIQPTPPPAAAAAGGGAAQAPDLPPVQDAVAEMA